MTCEAGWPEQSCQGCDVGDCLLGSDPNHRYRDATVPVDGEQPGPGDRS